LEGNIFIIIFVNYRNYAPTLKTGRKGNELYGCDQALWLLHDYVTEVGTMNFFLFWKNE
jgi:branched-chain amino acid aminotransferase